MGHKTVMSIYSDKLAHVQDFINCRYSVAQMCTCEDALAHHLGTPSIAIAMVPNISNPNHFKSEQTIQNLNTMAVILPKPFENCKPFEILTHLTI